MILYLRYYVIMSFIFAQPGFIAYFWITAPVLITPPLLLYYVIERNVWCKIRFSNPPRLYYVMIVFLIIMVSACSVVFQLSGRWMAVLFSLGPISVVFASLYLPLCCLIGGACSRTCNARSEDQCCWCKWTCIDNCCNCLDQNIPRLACCGAKTCKELWHLFNFVLLGLFISATLLLYYQPITGSEYVDIMKSDYQMRTSKCYFAYVYAQKHDSIAGFLARLGL